MLKNIGTAIDPRLLVKRIPPGLRIPGLKKSLGKMMKDYRLQVNFLKLYNKGKLILLRGEKQFSEIIVFPQVFVQEGCKKIVVKDYFNLQARLINTQKRGIRAGDEQICGACNERTFHRGDSPSNLVIFYCKHIFHEDCLNLLFQCRICDSQMRRN